MAKTYEVVATSRLTTASASITFSSIPNTYTDLKLIINAESTGDSYLVLRLNSNSGTVYSNTEFRGIGSGTGSSQRLTGETYAYLSPALPSTTTDGGVITADMSNYSNSNVFKTVLVRQGTAAGGVMGIANLYRSTSVISAMEVIVLGNTLAIGSVLTLYGIKAGS